MATLKEVFGCKYDIEPTVVLPSPYRDVVSTSHQGDAHDHLSKCY